MLLFPYSVECPRVGLVVTGRGGEGLHRTTVMITTRASACFAFQLCVFVRRVRVPFHVTVLVLLRRDGPAVSGEYIIIIREEAKGCD